MEWRLFEGVPQEEVQRVLALARRRRFARGEVVFHQDDLADSVHLIVSGRFASARRTPLGEDTLLSIHPAGDAFGELALVSESTRAATVTALEAGETMCVHRIDFDRLRVDHPSIDRMLVGLLAYRLRHMNERLAEAFYEPADRRVLRRLLELGASYGEKEVPLTQEQLASLAGTSRATVNAVLVRERKRGTITMRRGAVAVVDRAAIARRAGLPPT